MASPCRLKPRDLIAYQDGTLPVGRREIVEAHLTACRHCRERLAAFHEVDRILQEEAGSVGLTEKRRAELHARLKQEASRRPGLSDRLTLATPLQRDVVARFLVALLGLLAVLPAATQAGFPLGRFVHFAEVEIRQALPHDTQAPVQHVAPSDSGVTEPSFPAVTPADLPLGLVRAERSVPDPERIELLYRNETGIAILVVEVPAAAGMVTLGAEGTEPTRIEGTEILLVKDPRPGAVAAVFWERAGVFFDVKVLETPTGEYGGLKRADALRVVNAFMAAQDAAQE